LVKDVDHLKLIKPGLTFGAAPGNAYINE